MKPELRPAVHDLALVSALDCVVALAVCVAVAVMRHGDGVGFAAVWGLGLAAIGAPFAVVRGAGPIVAEAAETDAGEPGGSAVLVVLSSLAVLAPLVLAFADTDVGLGYAVAMAAVSFWWLCTALWLRRWERETGRRMLYRPVYRWAGTGNRVFGRGWFDPANFVSVPRP